MCFSMNFANVLRTPSLYKIYKRLLLELEQVIVGSISRRYDHVFLLGNSILSY